MFRSVLILTLALSTLGTPAFAQSSCTALKYILSGKAAFLTAKCYAKAAKKGVVVDPECLDKVQEFLTKKWPKAESKGDCLTVDDQSTLQTDIDGCVDTMIDDLGTPIAATCGNNVKEQGEECDGTDNPCYAGVGSCGSDCTCDVCSCTNGLSPSCFSCLTSCLSNCAGDPFCESLCPGICCSPEEIACKNATSVDVLSCVFDDNEFALCACAFNSGVSECGCTCDCLP